MLSFQVSGFDFGTDLGNVGRITTIVEVFGAFQRTEEGLQTRPIRPFFMNSRDHDFEKAIWDCGFAGVMKSLHSQIDLLSNQGSSNSNKHACKRRGCSSAFKNHEGRVLPVSVFFSSARLVPTGKEQHVRFDGPSSRLVFSQLQQCGSR